MNLLEIKNKLFEWFLKNEKLILPDDFLGVGKLFVVTEYPEFDLAATKAALQSYIETGLVKSFEFKDAKKDKIGYCLCQPLQSWDQSVTISGELAAYISSTLNEIRGKDSDTMTNPLAITSRDLEELLIVIGGLYKERENYFGGGSKE